MSLVLHECHGSSQSIDDESHIGHAKIVEHFEQYVSSSRHLRDGSGSTFDSSRNEKSSGGTRADLVVADFDFADMSDWAEAVSSPDILYVVHQLPDEVGHYNKPELFSVRSLALQRTAEISNSIMYTYKRTSTSTWEHQNSKHTDYVRSLIIKNFFKGIPCHGCGRNATSACVDC